MPRVTFPSKFAHIFAPARLKAWYGGRGSGKSWSVARALILKALQGPERILCVRELQSSIDESVHKLLESQIDLMGLTSAFEVLKQGITCRATGAEFFFEGIRHNVNKIKSYEAVTICWVEEAHNVTRNSWRVLTPTIRAPGSEIWVTFNPELETDYTYRWLVKGKPTGAVVTLVNWYDNPWFPQDLKAEMEDMKRDNYLEYLWIWEGHTKQIVDGAIFGEELAEAHRQGRITRVPYAHEGTVDGFFDLGRADQTAIWLGQYIGFEYRWVRYYANSQKHIDFYLQKLQEFGYTYGTLWLPHDAKAKTIGTKRSVEEQVRAKGFQVRIVPRLSIADRINAARSILGASYFDADGCEDGLQCLRHARYDVDPETKRFSDKPVHDQWSHGFDAFTYAAVSMKAPKQGSLAQSSAVKALKQMLHIGDDGAERDSVYGNLGGSAWMAM